MPEAAVLVLRHPRHLHPAQVPHPRGACRVINHELRCILSGIVGDSFPMVHFRWRAPPAQSLTSLYKLLLPRDGSNWNEIYCLFEDQRNPKVPGKSFYHLFGPISGGPRPPVPSPPAAWTAASVAPSCILPGGSFQVDLKPISIFCFQDDLTQPPPCVLPRPDSPEVWKESNSFVVDWRWRDHD